MVTLQARLVECLWSVLLAYQTLGMHYPMNLLHACLIQPNTGVTILDIRFNIE